MGQKVHLILFSLIKSAIRGGQMSESEREIYSDEMLPELLKIAQKHDIAHLVGQGLYCNGLLQKEGAIHEEFRRQQLLAVYRYEQQNRAYKDICKVFEDEKIAYIPLKGIVVRELYPEPWMRTSCDIDILVREEDLNRAVDALTANQWRVEGKKNYHDISLYSSTGIHLELHFSIKENIQSIDRVLELVWENSFSVSGKQCEYRQTKAYLLFHLLAHMSYHFISGGCGIRSLLDVWLLKEKLEAEDQEKLQLLCANASLGAFYESVCCLIRVWMENAEHTSVTQRMEKFILDGGIYGNACNHVMMDQAKSGGKLKNIFNRIFMPRYKMQIRYRVLESHKWLLPVFWIVRWFEVFTKGRLKSSIYEFTLNRNNSREQIEETEEFLREIGLKS